MHVSSVQQQHASNNYDLAQNDDNISQREWTGRGLESTHHPWISTTTPRTECKRGGEVGKEGFRPRILRGKDVCTFGAHFRGHRGGAWQSKENWTVLLQYGNNLGEREVLDILPSYLSRSEILL
jgi:hypothetical protein